MVGIGRIRLADIDSPDRGEVGYQEARNYILSLVLDQEVFLDIDDIYETDIYDRFIAVTYVCYNSTHLLNINKVLLEKNYANLMNYPN